MTLKSLNAQQRLAAPTDWLDSPKLRQQENALSLDPADGARFVRTLSESRLIGRQTELLAWLKGEVQQFLPHQILVAAWGDFARWRVSCEVVSERLGARVLSIAGGPVDDLLRESYAQWLQGGREPLVIDDPDATALRNPRGTVHGALQSMGSLLVHGVRDRRSGCDSFYIALDTRRLPSARVRSDFVALSHLLVCQIDIVWRRLAAFRLEDLRDEAIAVEGRELSVREREILGRLSIGSTNSDIAEALQISLFTVKNHMKRIFRKMGASNRTQAVARYNEALMQSAKGVPG
jgi:transcriptional regulator EpsA